MGYITLGGVGGGPGEPGSYIYNIPLIIKLSMLHVQEVPPFPSIPPSPHPFGGFSKHPPCRSAHGAVSVWASEGGKVAGKQKLS